MSNGYTSIDWRTNNLPPIENQGYCGSCWAFSAMATLEAHISIQNNDAKPIPLSKQQPVSCDETNWGCNGGYFENCWSETKNHPVPIQTEYQYTSGDTEIDGVCLYNADKRPAWKVDEWTPVG